jgi:hypothetical protein
MEGYERMDVWIDLFLSPVLVGEWSVPGPGHFTSGEIIPSPYLINNYAMKAYWGVDVYIHVFLTTVLVSEWSALGHDSFTHAKRSSYS